MAELNPSGTQVAFRAAIDFINKDGTTPERIAYDSHKQAWDQYVAALKVIDLDQSGNPIKEPK